MGKQNNTVKIAVPGFFGCSGVPFRDVPGCLGVPGCSGVSVFLVLVHAGYAVRGMRYAVCNIYKTRICLVTGYAVRGTQCVIYSRSVLEVGACFGSWIKERVIFMSCTLVSALGLMSFWRLFRLMD